MEGFRILLSWEDDESVEAKDMAEAILELEDLDSFLQIVVEDGSIYLVADTYIDMTATQAAEKLKTYLKIQRA